MKFTGHEREPHNHDYMHARHYNPTTLRFLTPDLLRGDAHRPQTFNPFAYVGGNPINYVDPFGLWVTFTGEIEVIGVDPCRADRGRCYLLLRSATWNPRMEEGPGGDPPNPPPQRPTEEQRVGSMQDVLVAFAEPLQPCADPLLDRVLTTLKENRGGIATELSLGASKFGLNVWGQLTVRGGAGEFTPLRLYYERLVMGRPIPAGALRAGAGLGLRMWAVSWGGFEAGYVAGTAIYSNATCRRLPVRR